MPSFEVKDKFLLDGKPFQIISGSIHYFRVVPEYWRDRLEKLKNMGCNTVETYIPWNMHEPHPGQYNFEGMLDVVKFIETAQELGLYIIIRPSPYICAEWELGGMPSWLLKEDNIKLRSNDSLFLKYVQTYFDVLLPKITPYQIDKGGNIILMQIENEYGYYGKDKSYLDALATMMRKGGVTVPFVTSDGPYVKSTFVNGQHPDALPTGNFGSHARIQFHNMKKWMKTKGPLMCMEFWVGWFDAWGNKEHKTSPVKRNLKDLQYMLKHGNVNFYMFHGGTNFGFMNGSNYYASLTPDVTSYDYDAPLSEDGKITPKYEEFRKLIKKYTNFQDVTFTTEIKQKAYGEIKATSRIRLFDILDDIAKKTENENPLSMEQINQNYGFILYRSQLNNPATEIKIEKAADRLIAYANQKKLFTSFDKEITKGNKLSTPAESATTLDILVENLGRVNFANKIPYQKKGIHRKILINNNEQKNWAMYSLDFETPQITKIEEKLTSCTILSSPENAPTFTLFTFTVNETCDTYLDFKNWGHGCAILNGFNLGRYWDIGPQKTLYIPAPLLKKGENQLIMFETEGKISNSITFRDKHDLG